MSELLIQTEVSVKRKENRNFFIFRLGLGRHWRCVNLLETNHYRLCLLVVSLLMDIISFLFPASQVLPTFSALFTLESMPQDMDLPGLR